jgi:hypothetical protein
VPRERAEPWGQVDGEVGSTRITATLQLPLGSAPLKDFLDEGSAFDPPNEIGHPRTWRTGTKNTPQVNGVLAAYRMSLRGKQRAPGVHKRNA